MKVRVSGWKRGVVALALGLIGCTGGPTEEVTIAANEYKFESPVTTFKRGTSYRFTVKNTGLLAHEWVVLEKGAKVTHGSSGGHGGAVAEIPEKELVPGATASRTMSFPKVGEYEFACHIAGHYEAGMVLRVRVEG